MVCHVRFSNRPFGVKHFQTNYHRSVDVAHGLVLLFGIGTKALPSWDSKTRRNNLWGGIAVLQTVGPSGHGHGTQKPVECMRRPIENNSSPGQAIYEPFSGSGTTVIAAEMTGRSCFSIEIDPAYVDVAVLRWQAFTGETAMLEGGGRSFAQVAAERHCEAAKAAEVAH